LVVRGWMILCSFTQAEVVDLFGECFGEVWEVFGLVWLFKGMDVEALGMWVIWYAVLEIWG
jgi:hypothetical protein